MPGEDEWWIGLSYWIVKDGNYGDFRVGQVREFAVEFHSTDLRPRPPGPLRAQRRDDRYDVDTQVVFADHDVGVIDIGILAYANQPEGAPLREGDLLTGIVRLGVDPFFYFEEHKGRKGIPELVYSWTLTGMWFDATPFVLDEARGMYVRDERKVNWVPVAATDAAPKRDISTHEFCFRCVLGSEPPGRNPRR